MDPSAASCEIAESRPHLDVPTMMRRLPLPRWLLAVAPVWAHTQDPVPRPEHPEPTAVRSHWANLNGAWQFRFDRDDVGLNARWHEPNATGFDQKIVVP